MQPDLIEIAKDWVEQFAEKHKDETDEEFMEWLNK